MRYWSCCDHERAPMRALRIELLLLIFLTAAVLLMATIVLETRARAVPVGER